MATTGKYLVTLFFLLMITPSWLYALEVKVDRNVVEEGETLTLIITSEKELDLEKQLALLTTDFDVLNRNQSVRTMLSPGKLQTIREWQIRLLPKRSGQLTIPSMTIDQEKTKAINIRVLAANNANSAGNPIIVTAELDKNSAYVQEQIILTLKIYHRINISSASLSELAIDNTLTSQLGQDRQYSTEHNGLAYNVIERRYALFPQKSGALTIPGLIFEAQIPDPQARRRSLFDDAFGISPFAQPTKTLRRRSPELELTVQAKPLAAARHAHWLPAQELQLSEEPIDSSKTLNVGDPITRTVTLTALGLMADQLPDLEMDDIENTGLFPDQAERESRQSASDILGTVKQKTAVIANEAGELVLPEIRVDWWNVRTNKAETAILPEHVLNIEASKHANVPFTPNATQAISTSDIAEPKTIEVIKTSSGYWPWFTLAAVILWLTTTLLWLKERRRPTPANTLSEQEVKRKEKAGDILKRLKNACTHNQAEHARKEIVAWMQLQQITPPPFTLAALASKLDCEHARDALKTLDQHLYARNTQTWNGMECWTQLSPILKNPENLIHQREKYRNRENTLPPLYQA